MRSRFCTSHVFYSNFQVSLLHDTDGGLADKEEDVTDGRKSPSLTIYKTFGRRVGTMMWSLPITVFDEQIAVKWLLLVGSRKALNNNFDTSRWLSSISLGLRNDGADEIRKRSVKGKRITHYPRQQKSDKFLPFKGSNRMAVETISEQREKNVIPNPIKGKCRCKMSVCVCGLWVLLGVLFLSIWWPSRSMSSLVPTDHFSPFFFLNKK